MGTHYIHCGRTSNIWKATDHTAPGCTKLVVLKELRHSYPIDKNRKDDDCQRLLKYVHLIRACRHSNVSEVHGLAYDDDACVPPSIVLPYFPGGDFLGFLRSSPRRSDHDLAEMMHFFRQANGVLGGLACLHNAEIIHGNIYDGNLLVDTHGRIILCDAAFRSTILDIDASVVQTYRWMPRERLIPDQTTQLIAPPNKAADVYALAHCILQVHFARIHSIYRVID
ncbi:hypothetical protein HWV62_20358 [Athelia sp. TMB]|nr:hypothetical protein HWV62_20358 [Athelia sp. TMB]